MAVNKTLIIRKIKSYYGFETDAQYARFLGIAPQLLSKWQSRNTFNSEILITKCTDINAQWLITGEGNMLKKDQQCTETAKNKSKETDITANNNTKTLSGNSSGYSYVDKYDNPLQRKIDNLKTRIKILTNRLSDKEMIIKIITQELKIQKELINLLKSRFSLDNKE